LPIAIIVGTRPEIIKMSPVIRACAAGDLACCIVDAGQHYDRNMSAVFFEELELPRPDYQLAIGSGSQGQQTGRLLMAIEKVLLDSRPSIVLVQGDTNTVLAGALAAAKRHIPVGHVEAGLRSFDRNMPEEINRVLADHVSDLLFAPTAGAAEHLLREGIERDKIFVTGNTIVDAVWQSLEIARRNSTILAQLSLAPRSYILLTAHRAENVDNRQRLADLLSALQVVHRATNLPIIYPIHPRTKLRITESGLCLPAGVRAVEPLGFLDFLSLEAEARLVLTDSGGVQEESCILGVPCVTLRDNTERPETVEVGANVVAGVRSETVLAGVEAMLKVAGEWRNPFGDGESGARISRIVATFLHGDAESELSDEAFIHLVGEHPHRERLQSPAA
jgi:UDP-N-acetylglucosamine 2-epimerase (non-hydrolysing)